MAGHELRVTNYNQTQRASGPVFLFLPLRVTSHPLPALLFPASRWTLCPSNATGLGAKLEACAKRREQSALRPVAVHRRSRVARVGAARQIPRRGTRRVMPAVHGMINSGRWRRSAPAARHDQLRLGAPLVSQLRARSALFCFCELLTSLRSQISFSPLTPRSTCRKARAGLFFCLCPWSLPPSEPSLLSTVKISSGHPKRPSVTWHQRQRLDQD